MPKLKFLPDFLTEPGFFLGVNKLKPMTQPRLKIRPLQLVRPYELVWVINQSSYSHAQKTQRKNFVFIFPFYWIAWVQDFNLKKNLHRHFAYQEDFPKGLYFLQILFFCLRLIIIENHKTWLKVENMWSCFKEVVSFPFCIQISQKWMHTFLWMKYENMMQKIPKNYEHFHSWEMAKNLFFYIAKFHDNNV